MIRSQCCYICLSELLRFERELEALRKELAETAASRSGAATPMHEDPHDVGGSTGLHQRNISELTLSESNTSESPVLVAKDLGSMRDFIATPVSGVVSATTSEQVITNEPKKER